MTGEPNLTWNLVADVRHLLAFPFMQNAMLAGTIVAVLAAVVGWFMVLRGQSFAGHTMSVVGFPGAAGAVWLGLSAATGYFAFCIAAALILAAVPRTGRERREESSVIGVLQAFALALGLLFVSLFKGFLGGVNALLFGSFLGITNSQVLTLLVLSVVALGVLVVIGRPLVFASVDADVAAARGVPTRLLSTVFLLLLAITTAEVSQITGALLVFALLVMPAAAAQRLTVDPRLSLALAVTIGVLVTWLGLGGGLLLDLPDRLLHHVVRVRRVRARRALGGRTSVARPAGASGRCVVHGPAMTTPAAPYTRASDPFTGIGHMLSEPFIAHALLAGTFIALASGLVGFFVVLRRQVFAGDALSHVAFTGAVAALAAGIDLRVGLFVACVGFALALAALGRVGHHGSRGRRRHRQQPRLDPRAGRALPDPLHDITQRRR